MLKKITFSILATLVISFTYAQKVTLSWSAAYRIDAAHNTLFSGSENQLLKLSLVPQSDLVFGNDIAFKHVFARYNKQLKEMGKETFSAAGKGVELDGQIQVKGNLYFFTNTYNKAAKGLTYYCQPVEIQSLKNRDENLLLTTLIVEKESKKPTLSYHLSEDSTKILLTSFVSKSETGKCYLGVYDENMKKLWDKTIDLQQKGKAVLLDQKVTNDGKVMLLIKHFDQGTDKEQTTKDSKKVPTYSTKLLWYAKDGDTPKELSLNTGDKFIHSLAFAKQQNNESTLFGLYQQKPQGNINGYFTVQVNTNNFKATTTTTGEFESGLLETLEKDEQGSKSKKEGGLSPFFKFVKMETRANGDQDFLLEFYESASTPTGPSMVSSIGPSAGLSTNKGTVRSYSDIYHGNIIDINLKANGTKIITRIPKLQNVADLEHLSSFNTLVYKDKLLIFYNDNDDNLKQEIRSKPKKTKLGVGGRKIFGRVDANLTMAVIDSQGNLSRTTLLDKKQSEFLAAINVSIKLGDHKLALYAINGYKEMIGVLDVE